MGRNVFRSNAKAAVVDLRRVMRPTTSFVWVARGRRRRVQEVARPTIRSAKRVMGERRATFPFLLEGAASDTTDSSAARIDRHGA